MTIREANLLRIRLSPRYRAAIWLGRLGNAIGFSLLAWLTFGEPPPAAIFVGTPLMLATSAPAVWLLSRVLPGERRGWTWTADPDAGRVVLRDLHLPKPRA